MVTRNRPDQSAEVALASLLVTAMHAQDCFNPRLTVTSGYQMREREMLRRSMEKDGSTLSEAENGRIALARLDDGIPAIILLDLMMPEMDGFTFMQELRERDDCAAVPVIVITAKDLTAEDHQRLNGGVSRILQKGATSAEQLLAEVRALLASQPRESL